MRKEEGINILRLTEDKKWSEVIKLYSGLFNDENERAEFIIDLSDSDISLAADCELSSIIRNSDTTDNLKKIAISKYLINKEKTNSFLEAIIILKLGDENYFLDYLEHNFAKGNIRELFFTGLIHLSESNIFLLLSKLIRNRRSIYSKWIITYMLHLEKYSISIEQAAEAIEALTLIKKRISYRLALKLIYQYNLVERYSRDYLLNLILKKGSKDSYKIANWLENIYH